MTPEAPHSVGNVPCAVCQGDHRDPKDKIIADLLAACRVALETCPCAIPKPAAVHDLILAMKLDPVFASEMCRGCLALVAAAEAAL